MKIWSWAITLIFVCSLGLFIAPGIADSRITDVSASSFGYGMALNDNGTVWLWGAVDQNDSVGHQPVIAAGIDHVVDITSYMYPAVLKDDGTVWVLTSSSYHYENGILKDSWPKINPVQVRGLSDIVAISGSKDAGDLMALKKDGTVWMIGNNAYGQLATEEHYGDTFYSLGQLSDPVQVKGLTDIKAIAMGDGHALALKNDGTVWSWGFNSNGQLGDGTVTYTTSPPITAGGKTTPVMVSGLTNVTAIAAGYESSMALKDDGTVWTWGSNIFGLLGAGIPENVEGRSTLPVQVDSLTNVTTISAGQMFGLALRDDGTVWAWGDNSFGTLGDGTTGPKDIPTQVKGLQGIVSVSSGSDYCFALDQNGTIWAWGDDYSGQLGDRRHGDNNYSTIASKVPFSQALSGLETKPSWMVSPRPPVQVSLPAPDNSSIEYMAVINNTIYAFSSNGLMAMDGNGAPKWNVSIPGTWTYDNAYGLIVDSNRSSIGYVSSSLNPMPTPDIGYDTDLRMVKMVPTFAALDGHVYLYVLDNQSDSAYSAYNLNDQNGILSLSTPAKEADKELIAVTPDGKIEWARTFTDNIAVEDRSHVEAQNGKIYLYHDYNESVFDTSGNLLFTINNVADPVSVDEAGYIYAMPAVKGTLASMPTALDGEYFDYRIPSNLIEKYGPDGKLVWQKTLSENATQPYFSPAVWNDKIGIPLYMNGMLYVPVESGIIALNKDGVSEWTKKLDDAYSLFYLMPMDSKGDLYLYVQHSYERYHDSNVTVVAIKPDGSELGQVDIGPVDLVLASDGVLYIDGKPLADRQATNFSPDSLDKAWVNAYDMTQGKYIWNFTTPIGNMRTITVNATNALTLFPDYGKSGTPAGSMPYSNSLTQIIPAGNLTYIYLRTAAWDEPVVYNKSTYTYYSALYAVDMDGKLVWQKPMDLFVTAAAANNSTIYYGTNGGGITFSTIDVVAGLAIAGSILLFFKFFLLGSVTRARSKIDKNDNRNRVYLFIAEHPGSTLYEMAKEMKMNIGTLRYHLMILGLNHRIVSYNDDSKFVRYFTNSNTYSKDDQMVISLIHREPVARILKAILEKGEITNSELCIMLGLPESAASKYLAELSRKGILIKTPELSARASYSIKPEHLDRVSNAKKLM